MSVQLLDAHGQPLRTLYTSPPLGNYSYDAFHGFSPPINVSAKGLDLRIDGAVTQSHLVSSPSR